MSRQLPIGTQRHLGDVAAYLEMDKTGSRSRCSTRGTVSRPLAILRLLRYNSAKISTSSLISLTLTSPTTTPERTPVS